MTDPKHAVDQDTKIKRTDYFTRAELVPLEMSWMASNPGVGKEAFYRWFAHQYLGLPPDNIGDAETERVRQLFRDAKVRARKAGWLTGSVEKE
ncbi:hypothetical protein CSIRO_2769 [Bradyrhizobiaceae bacterium SG-6C]|nr:hypothetical protein CSIRO_2769 [Bradyrhizobiaceae bacterium SG-6C]